MDFFNDLLANIIGYYEAFIAFLPKLVIGLVVFLLLLWIGGRSKRLFQSRLGDRIDDELLTSFLAQIVRYVWVIIGFLLFLKIIGWGGAATSILATAGVSAFIIGFAFKDIGENFLAGIVMAFKRPFKLGDVIETNGIVGTINAMSIRETLVKTFDGKDVHIPNGLILKNPLQNYTIDGFLRFDFNLRLDYHTDFQKAGSIVMEQIKQTPGILQENKLPVITISGLDANVVNMTVYFWINTFDPNTSVFTIKRELIANILKALSDEGIYLPHNIVEMKQLNELAG